MGTSYSKVGDMVWGKKARRRTGSVREMFIWVAVAEADEGRELTSANGTTVSASGRGARLWRRGLAGWWPGVAMWMGGRSATGVVLCLTRPVRGERGPVFISHLAQSSARRMLPAPSPGSPTSSHIRSLLQFSIQPISPSSPGPSSASLSSSSCPLRRLVPRLLLLPRRPFHPPRHRLIPTSCLTLSRPCPIPSSTPLLRPAHQRARAHTKHRPLPYSGLSLNLALPLPPLSPPPPRILTNPTSLPSQYPYTLSKTPPHDYLVPQPTLARV